MPRRASKILEKLAGGDHRSLGRSGEVVRDVLADPSLFETVFQGLFSPSSVVRMRAADAVEKITRERADLLTPFKRQFMEQLAGTDQQEVRWHVAQMFSRLRLNQPERDAAAEILLHYLTGRSRIVKTCAIQALTELARKDPSLRECARRGLDEAVQTGSPAMRSRARKLLAVDKWLNEE